MIILIVCILIIILIVVANRNKEPKRKHSTFDYGDLLQPQRSRENSKVIRLLKETRQLREEWSNKLFEDLTNQHKNKTLKQIEDYIKERQQNNDPYWSRNGMEYKILMTRSRELFAKEVEEITKLLSSDQIELMDYDELLRYYWMVSNNIHIYKNVDLVNVVRVLDNLSFDKFAPIVKTKTPGSVMIWIKARKNEGQYISERLIALAEEIESSETEENQYKRKLKNLQTKLSKAKSEGVVSRVLQLQQEIDQFKMKTK